MLSSVPHIQLSVMLLSPPLLDLFYQLFSDGRKPVYLISVPLLFFGSLGVASSRSIPQLMLWRFVQAFGSSPGLAVGAGVIGDIYKLEERGQAMGIFFAVCHCIFILENGINARFLRPSL